MEYIHQDILTNHVLLIYKNIKSLYSLSKSFSSSNIIIFFSKKMENKIVFSNEICKFPFLSICTLLKTQTLSYSCHSCGI